MKKLLSLSLILFSTALFASENVETYTIDPVHSSVKFSIRHFVAKTTGKFNQFEGTITIDKNDWSKSSVNTTIQVVSVDTANEDRDAHLQEEDYFNSAEYSAITFESTKWETTDKENIFKVTGNLTMLGKTKEVVLEANLLGFGPGMEGAYLSGWEVTTQLDRTEWGISGGQPAVGTTVDVVINIEAIRQ
jgi:polyisoprenoid-binding protein YceI